MIQRRFTLLGLGLCVTTLSVSAGANFYQGIRQMGMGGAAIAVVNDETAVLLNPNGLARLREPYVTLIDPEITTNSGSLSTVQDLSIIDANDVPKIYEELASRQDERYFARGQIFPSYANRNFGVGFLGRYDVTALRSSATQALNLNYISDWAAAFGYNKSFWGGLAKVGIAGRVIDRVEYRGDIDPSTQGLDLKSLASEGLGLGVDLGVSLTSTADWLPTFSAVLKDIGDTSFTLGDGMRNYLDSSRPDKIPMELDLALAIFPIWSNSSRGTFTVQYDNALKKGDTERKLHAGVEINLGDRFFLRGGWNRGYATAGFEWSTQLTQIQLAYYGEEIGTDDNPLRDERLALKFLLRF